MFPAPTRVRHGPRIRLVEPPAGRSEYPPVGPPPAPETYPLADVEPFLLRLLSAPHLESRQRLERQAGGELVGGQGEGQ